jgi:hypothetical protein
MTTLSRADRWAALAVGAFTLLLLGGMSWLIGGARISLNLPWNPCLRADGRSPVSSMSRCGNGEPALSAFRRR